MHRLKSAGIASNLTKHLNSLSTMSPTNVSSYIGCVTPGLLPIAERSELATLLQLPDCVVEIPASSTA